MKLTIEKGSFNIYLRIRASRPRGTCNTDGVIFSWISSQMVCEEVVPEGHVLVQGDICDEFLSTYLSPSMGW
uniref:Uncharacterized protein n=1 Tax=Helianthus annuus TaxID=4232 RepID=A0A251RQD0_HELAN